jgi:hypothetical protein
MQKRKATGPLLGCLKKWELMGGREKLWPYMG